MKKIEITQDELSYELEEEIKTLRTNLLFCGDDKKSHFAHQLFSGGRKDKYGITVGAVFGCHAEKSAACRC